MLCAIVKIDPSNPIDNPAEVRVYDFNARMILPETASNIDHSKVIERKIRPDSKWTVGDPQFKFMLFYRKLTLVNKAGSLAQETALEYRSPSPVHSFYLPRFGDQSGREGRTGLARVDSSNSEKFIGRSMSHVSTPGRFPSDDDEGYDIGEDKERSSEQAHATRRGDRTRSRSPRPDEEDDRRPRGRS
ncbi:hypothetical protein GGR55DRAFT_682448 [Xylaria sp. FL0064]|nr:hypothetical protein GGR55DRAFT_682448 [Xylaria sp. FL0064]